MLAPMVAMPKLDLIVAGIWISALVVILLAQGVWAWLGFRRASRYADEAARLARATRPAPFGEARVARPEPGEHERTEPVGAEV